jgi:hypothetical protein
MAGEFRQRKLYRLLKLRSDQTDSVSVDLHQRRLDADGVPFSFDHTCGRLRGREKKSRRSKIVRYRRQSAHVLSFDVGGRDTALDVVTEI